MKEVSRRRALIVSFLTAAGVFGSILAAMSAPGQRYLAPGALRGSHGAKQLACSACHDAFSGVPDANCEKCHKKIGQGRLKKHGSHAGMIGACIGCHFSHGRFAEPDTRVEPGHVDHTLTRFSLSRHEKQGCADCHGARYTSFNSQARDRCVSCHLNFGLSASRYSRGAVAWASGPASKAFERHRRAVGKRCLKCHKGGSRIVYRHAPAARGFFVGKHAAADCADCHKNDKYQRARNACEKCHRRSHGPALTDGCDRCHGLKGWRPATPDHTGKLGGDHLQLKCGDCHKTENYAGLSWACARCHQDRHQGSASDDCRRCHDESQWKPAKMDHAAATDACFGCHPSPKAHFPGGCARCHLVQAWKPAKAAHAVRLGGAHSALNCAACHRGQRFSGLSWACAGCHSSRHNGYGSNCGACHSQSKWRPASFNHAVAGGDCSVCHQRPGGHYSGSCSQCHKTAGSWASAAGNHPRIKEHSSTSFPCAYCHPSGYGSSDCTRCHKSGSPGEDDD